jgi:hypothetical protein
MSPIMLMRPMNVGVIAFRISIGFLDVAAYTFCITAIHNLTWLL